MRHLPLALGLLLALGCGPSLRIVKRAEPNPFLGKVRYQLTLDLSKMTYNGKTEAQFLATASEGAAGWGATQQAFTTGFLSAFRQTAERKGLVVVDSGPQYRLSAVVGAIDTGHPWAGPSRTSLVVQVLNDDQVLEELVLESETPGGSGHSSPDPRIHEDGVQLGTRLARYVSDRAR